MLKIKIKIRKRRHEWIGDVLANRRLLLRLAAAGVAAGTVITLSMPDEYECTVFTVAEPRVVTVDDEGTVTGYYYGNGTRIRDGVMPSMYRRVVASPHFLLPLSRMEVRLSGEEGDTLSLYDYLLYHRRLPWWNYLLSGAYRAAAFVLSPFTGSGRTGGITAADSLMETLPADGTADGVMRITRADAVVASALFRRISVDISREKQSVAISVRMQNPLVAALVADSLQARLQQFVQAYRRTKEQERLTLLEQRRDSARTAYLALLDDYARHADANRDLALASARRELVNLRVDVQQAYAEYSRATSLVQAARKRTAFTRPVLMVVEPASVPRHRSSPNPLLNIAVCLGLALGGGALWIRLKKRRFTIRIRRRRNRKV